MIEVEKTLPDFRTKGDGKNVVVAVEMESGEVGKAVFGYSGKQGEPLEGSFQLQKELASKITHWAYLN